ncbi:MAG TPA: SRPBCC family protein [Pseudoxanthomonas sp.]|nr:SRPBCC family protein [Pseudoxanthomonas sp.]
MNDSYGSQIAADTLRLQRSLPGPIERVWAYLTESDKRGQWLATGEMDLRMGGKVHLFFRHADLSPQQAPVPEKYKGMEDGVGMDGRITLCKPPHQLGYTWGESDGSESEVRFDLSEQNGRVLLTITHSRLHGHEEMLSVAGGWHTHVDILVDRLEGREPSNFWVTHGRIEAEYAQRLSP